MSRYLADRYQEMQAYTPGEQPKAGTLIKLNTNESPFPPSPKAIAAVTKEALGDLRLYCPIEAFDLRRAIAEKYRLSPERIIVSNGSDEVLAFAFLAFGDSGAYFPDVTYGFYKVWAQLYGVDFVQVPVHDDFSIYVGDYLRNDRMIVIANPNAPTGLALSLREIEIILRANPDHVVIIDEAYVDFGAQSAVGLLDKFDNLLIARTFSKSHALAGARLGYIMGNAELIADLNKIKFSFNPYNVNSITQIMGAHAMHDGAYSDQCMEQISIARDYTSDALCALGFDVIPSSANFVFAAPPDGDGELYSRSLRERGILVRHFNADRIRAYVRITIGTMMQMRTLIAATKEIVKP